MTPRPFVSGLAIVFSCAAGLAFGDEAEQGAAVRAFARSAAWLRLLHYHGDGAEGWESGVSDPAFFVSPNGRVDPDAELVRSLELLHDEALRGTDGQATSFQCRFPARYSLISASLPDSVAGIPPAECRDLAKFVRQVDAQRAQVVFSSYYMGNPVSSFGHTFLKFRKRSIGERQSPELLDWTMSYAADVDGSGPFEYVWKGLTGGFRGRFSVVPYHIRVREYNDYEARDLWVYDLWLTGGEVHQLVLHVWELSSTFADYRFASENCSYHVLAAIEAAVPRADLTGNLGWITLPLDTLKVLMSTPGLVSSRTLRRSAQKDFWWRYDSATEATLLEFEGLVEHGGFASKPSVSAEAMDLALAYYGWKHPYSGAPDTSGQGSAVDARAEIISKRAALPPTAPELEGDATVSSPDQGHRSSRFAARVGADDEGPVLDYALRPLLHDRSDPPNGYPGGMQLVLFGLQGRTDLVDGDTRLQRFDLLQASWLNPVNRYAVPLSWSTSTGVARFYDERCHGCLGWSIDVGAGLSVQLGGDDFSLLAYGLPTLGFAYVPAAEQELDLGAGGRAGALLLSSSNTALAAETEYMWHFLGRTPAFDVRIFLSQGLSSTVAITAEAAVNSYRWEGVAGLSLFL